jgi:hypothetical protein
MCPEDVVAYVTVQSRPAVRFDASHRCAISVFRPWLCRDVTPSIDAIRPLRFGIVGLVG